MGIVETRLLWDSQWTEEDMGIVETRLLWDRQCTERDMGGSVLDLI
jgi:hypothetical protein